MTTHEIHYASPVDRVNFLRDAASAQQAGYRATEFVAVHRSNKGNRIIHRVSATELRKHTRGAA